jgi:RimJ/RimL family protein N-acetyltransferase/catechol 2,3-dioxygenase-like lactoylglutathione lyase family enzyme
LAVPDLRTARLRLRALTAEDVAAFVPIISDPEVMRYTGGARADRDGVRDWLALRLERSAEVDELGAWTIELAGTVIGIGSLWPARQLPGRVPEIGWMLARAHWRAGLATEAIRAVLHYGFRQLGLPAIFALIDPANTASLATATRLGFLNIGEHRRVDTGAPAEPGEPADRVLMASRPPTGDLHHIELWVPDLARAQASLGWLFAELGWVKVNSWRDGESWRYGTGYLVLEAGPDRVGDRHERCRPGLNHLAFRVADPAAVDALTAAARQRGWELLFADRHPHAGGDHQYAAYLADPDGFEIELVAEPDNLQIR